MNDPTIVSMFVGVAVILFVLGAGLVLSRSINTVAEQRLDDLSGGKSKGKGDPNSGMLLRPAAIELANASFWTKIIPNVENINTLYEQADVNISFERFLWIVGGMGIIGFLVPIFLGPHPLCAPIGAVLFGAMPFCWLVYRKNKRIKAFLTAMPEAVELISRALRAGHGLASGLRLVAEEMKGPIADEFGRVFEEQNLGIPIELSLRGLADRIPSMDVRFFVVAVIIQRSTGGDLAEVLDKIGKLIRQRFELFGHVKALTAEGRLSGIVLLALPPGLLAFLSVSNYGYIEPLFKTPLGNKMLMITAACQIIGAWMIQKIVSIKV